MRADDAIWFYVTVNGNIIHELKNESPEIMNNLYLFASGNFYNAAIGASIRRFRYYPSPGKFI